MALLVTSYQVLTGRDVVAALRTEVRRPAHTVWITFDDGRADVVERGQEVLDRAGEGKAFQLPEADR